jgi:hypothetical protein
MYGHDNVRLILLTVYRKYAKNGSQWNKDYDYVNGGKLFWPHVKHLTLIVATNELVKVKQSVTRREVSVMSR